MDAVPELCVGLWTPHTSPTVGLPIQRGPETGAEQGREVTCVLRL